MTILETLVRGIHIVLATLLLGLQSLLVGTPLQFTSTPYPVATTTLAAIHATTTSKLLPQAPSVQKKVATRAKELPVPTTPPPQQEETPVTEAPKDPTQLNTDVRTTLVNILCTTGGGGYLHPISGSGVFIDTRGIVLTNAHIGQYFLLRDYPTTGNIDCLVRAGSPAKPMYTARLLYLPPIWLDTNASEIVAQTPSGTGENDYAFLLVTGAVSGVTLPTSFPAIPLSGKEPALGMPVLLAAYPAGFLEGAMIQNNLYISSAFSSVQKLFTVGTSTIDVVSVGGTIVSQGGSSGGAMVRASDGNLIGIISTDTASSTTAGRDLHAITLAHVDRSLHAGGMGGIGPLLLSDVVKLADAFNTNVAPGLTKKLEAAIEKGPQL